MNLRERAYRQTPSWINALPENKRPKCFWFHRHRFVEAKKGEELGLRTAAYEPDVKENLRWISDASKRADLVMVSLHTDGSTDEYDSVPGTYVPLFARACIDAGADVFIGHGPHTLQGIEISKNRPIFYSLSNFFLQIAGVKKIPADIYEQYGLGSDATPSDYPRFTAKKYVVFSSKKERAWESVIARCIFKGRKITEIKLHPITLNSSKTTYEIGIPKLADENL